jgi:hypothetical protein
MRSLKPKRFRVITPFKLLHRPNGRSNPLLDVFLDILQQHLANNVAIMANGA